VGKSARFIYTLLLITNPEATSLRVELNMSQLISLRYYNVLHIDFMS
jgi:hypothetical protein